MNIMALIGILLVMAIPKFDPKQCEKIGNKAAKAVCKQISKKSIIQD